LLGVNAGTEHLAELSPAMLKARTCEALWQLFLANSRGQPLLLAIEDLQWIDATSEECLTFLVERLAGAPMFGLFTYRPGYTPPWLRYSFATQLALAHLTPHDSARVLHGVPGARQLPDTVAQMVLAKANGNPFFVEELARAMIEQGPQHAPSVLPDTIQAVLAARMDRFPQRRNGSSRPRR
jgi:predicted ATPase